MFIEVLGASAGGGLPQWNCGCANCQAARTKKLPQLTQSSVAVSVNGERWAILNASPDIRAQINQTAALHPKELRHSPIETVILTNGDIDHICGLLTLREKTAFEICATSGIFDVINSNSVFGVLDEQLVGKREIHLDEPFEACGLSFEAFAVPGKVALYLEGASKDDSAGDSIDTEQMGEQTIGLRISDGKSVLNYIPGCAALPDWLIEKIGAGDMVLFDGTVWEDNEMQQTGTGHKTGSRMGHISMAGANGSLAKLSNLGSCRKAYIHINNTNPVLNPDSAERAKVDAADWVVTQDGMRFEL